MNRTWIIALAAIAVIVVMVASLSNLGPDPMASSTPTLPALPTLRPTQVVHEPLPTEPPGPTVDPRSVAACKAGQVALLAGGWSGATGSMAGGASIVNVSSEACMVAGRPSMELVDRAGKVVATGVPSRSGEPAVLPPGGVGTVIAVWSNWCKDPPSTPLSIRVTMPTSGLALRAKVVSWDTGVGGSESSSIPRCDAPSAPSTIAAPVAFASPEPAQSPQPGIDDAACAVEDLVGFLGTWGAAAGTSYAPVVVFNRGGVGCVLDAAPPMELRDADGKSVPQGGPAAGSAPLNLPAGYAAITYAGFADWCLPAPKLPLTIDLRVGGERLALTPTSKGSTIGAPDCVSDPPSDAPDLFLSGPLALPDF